MAALRYLCYMDKLLLYVFGPLVFAAALLVIVTGIRRAIVRFRSRPTPDQIKDTYDAYLRRLLNPQPDAVERELGKFLPERLLQLYEDKTAIQAVGFQIEKLGKKRWLPKHWQVYCFEPLDLESLNNLPYEEDLGRNGRQLPRRIPESASPAHELICMATKLRSGSLETPWTRKLPLTFP